MRFGNAKNKLILVVLLVVAVVIAACASDNAAVPTPAPAAVVAATATVPVPVDAEAAPVEIATSVAAPVAAAEPVAPVTTRLNLNIVTSDELLNTIPGFSSRMVREFQEYRPYISIQQFRQEMGKYVDATVIAGYEQYVYVPVSKLTKSSTLTSS